MIVAFFRWLRWHYPSNSHNISFRPNASHVLCCWLLGALVYFSAVSIGVSAPLIVEPKFTQLSTVEGLSQDTINDLIIDRSGFLWVATASGINRFDGYRTLQVAGTKHQLTDMDTNSLAQDVDGHIWIGSMRSGLFRLDIRDGSTQQIHDFKIAEGTFSEPIKTLSITDAGALLVVTATTVNEVNTATLAMSQRFDITQSDLPANAQISQAILDANVLTLATSAGLFRVSQIDQSLQRVWPMDNQNVDVSNLVRDLDGYLWFSTNSQVYRSDTSEILASSFSVQLTKSNVLGIYPLSQDSAYLTTEDGLYSFSVEGKQLQHFLKPTDSRLYLSSDVVTDMVLDDKGNLWLGSSFDGALYWSTQSMRFKNIRQNRDDSISLSSNRVRSFAQFDNQGFWIGTDNGVNYYDFEEHEITGQWLTTNAVGASQSNLRRMVALNNELLISATEGLLRFDVQSKQLVELQYRDDQAKSVLTSPIKSLVKGAGNWVYFSTSKGFYQYHPGTGELTNLTVIDNNIDPEASFGFIAQSTQKPDVFWLSDKERLWRYDAVSQTVQLVYTLAREVLGDSALPESVLEDGSDALWVTFPRVGLIGVDATTYEPTSAYDKENLLPSNAIYGLKQDSRGGIWMSSHAGILKFDASGPYLQKYGIAQGLVGKEFNGLAHLSLLDGKFVYGSQKGFTLFDPLDFHDQSGLAPNVTVTGIQLGTAAMKHALHDLNGTEVELAHFDTGLTIELSTLAFEHQTSTQYQYILSGSDNFTYPTTTDPQLTFPKLEPGEYLLTATAFDPISFAESDPARIRITVKYAPWMSPFAYAIYILLFVAAIMSWWYRRDQQNKQVVMAHAQALESKNRLSLALRASNSKVWEWQEHNDAFFASRFNEELGYEFDNDRASFEEFTALIHKDDVLSFKSNWQAFAAQETDGFDVTYRLRSCSGQWLWYRDVGNSVHNPNLEERVVTGTYSNVTETVVDREKVRLFGEAFKHTRDWVVIFNPQMAPIAINKAFCDAFGIDEQGDLQAQLTRIFKLDADYPPRFWKKLQELSVAGHWKGEEKLQLDQGKAVNVLINMTSIINEYATQTIDYYLMIMSDISDQKEAEDELRRLANYDGLTNLPNRTLLLDRIKHGIDHANRHRSKMGVFFIDLDRFKQVNDSLGHKAGDELLKVVAQRLINLLRQDDTVARLGGDEFVVMVEEVKHPDRLSALAQQLIEVLEAPVQLGNQTVSVSSSIGIALFPGDAQNSEELLKNADLAMYHAKEEGRSNFQYFTEHMNEKAQQRLVLENRLKKAHQSKLFINYYQPIVNSQLGKVEGFELLMRWQHEGNMIPPDEFIPVAEELGLIENMTWDALERAMPVLSQWQSQDRSVYLSVNLSARHFERQISIEHIVMLLEQYSLPVSALRFEITESALMRDYERALEYMTSMRKEGFIIALDDFGTGYSSLKYLKEFPIQVLKVDKSFVDDIGLENNNEALVLTTLRMAESLNMYCVAEGIEHQRQIDFFSRHGCVHLQGYFYSRPLPSQETMGLIERNWLT